MKDYKKILEGVVNIINTAEKSDIGFTNICTYIGENCPELIESKDEKIRKALIRYHKSTIHIDGIKGSDIVSWLEKQGEQPQGKSAVKEEKVDSQNCAVDNVESKFKAGDWIIGIGISVNCQHTVFQVIEIKSGKYVIRDNIINHVFHIDIDECERTGKLWELSDAKEGDVLVCEGNIKNSNGIKYDRICLFNNLDNAFFALTKTSNYIEEYAVDIRIDYPNNTVPATKEQRDTLFKAMAITGYTFDFEKKELKKIDNK